MPTKLILIRHAHRDVMNRMDDNGLSEKGRDQALAISAFYQDQLRMKGVRLMASPKERCQETLAPLSKTLGIEVEVDPLLDEQGPHESEMEMIDRIQNFLAQAQSAEGAWVACSHGDWLPVAINSLSCQWVQMKKGSSVEVSWIGEEATVSEMRVFGRS
jgi:broad specificity phosphatase PhoE